MKRLSKDQVKQLERHKAELDELEGFLQDLHEEIDQYATGRSERWRESTAGREYEGWREDVEALLLQAEALASDLHSLPLSPPAKVSR